MIDNHAIKISHTNNIGKIQIVDTFSFKYNDAYTRIMGHTLKSLISVVHWEEQIAYNYSLSTNNMYLLFTVSYTARFYDWKDIFTQRHE